MKLDSRNRDPFPSECPSPGLKEKDTFLQLNEMSLTRKRSKVGSPSKSAEMSKKLLNVLYPIGKGGFGKVWKVEVKKTKAVFAMKEMSKVKIINKKSVSSVMN
jgi:hypothetical protein